MITKFKIFENVSIPPKIGDYVIIDLTGFANEKELYDLYSNNVGEIINMDDENTYDVKWEKVPDFSKDKFKRDYFRKNTRSYHISWFLGWSDNKEELEAYLISKKYNL